MFHPCTILVGDHPPVCAGEHDGGGDGGHLDHHLHSRDRPRLRFSNQFGRPETVSSGNETCPIMTLDVHIHYLCLQHLESGLMEVISPPSEFYPDLAGLRKTLGENNSQNKMFWRIKD